MTRFAILGGALLALASCKGKDQGATVPVTGEGGTGTGVTTFETADFGLDSRPANLACVAPDRPLSGFDAEFVRTYTSLNFSIPTWIGHSPDVPGWIYVVEQAGRIVRFQDDPGTSSFEVVLDIRSQVNNGSNEEGLLSMAFHPDFANNGEVYVYFTGNGQTSQLWRAVSTDGGATLSLDEELVNINQPYWNHNGGALAFGPDGYLYWGLGDGGSGGDPGNRAQDTNTWFGKIHRLDVDNGSPYAIPSDNPFAQGGGKPEVYAWGIRNPWRFAFDEVTGQLWLGDVGQNAWEEVDEILLGGNYGWRIMEGNACYNPPNNCNDAGLIRPYVEYRNSGGASVIGGVVYHGTELPALDGTFLYSDIAYGDVMGLSNDPIHGLPVEIQVASTGGGISHFATAPDGEVIAVNYYNGNVYRLQRVGAQAADPFPQKLSQTGCFDADDPTKPASGVIPYDVNHEFWSDGATKQRFLAVPDGKQIALEADGDFTFPKGTVLAKHIFVSDELVETRLMMRHDDGDWAGYAYRWDADGKDATLLPSGMLVEGLPGGESWSIPSRAECLRCHTSAAGGSVGLEIGQLNGMGEYPSTGRRANQLATLDHIGMFKTAVGDPASLEAWPARDDGSASDEEMARAWLHVNCSNCHRPGGPQNGDIDFRHQTAVGDMNACDVAPNHGDLGLGGSASVIAGGDPNASVVLSRIGRRDAYQMPPLATKKVDDVGVDAVTAWISALSCP